MIPDTELIRAAWVGATPVNRRGRKYRATYADGTVVSFAVVDAKAARRYAREYGDRILGSHMMAVNVER